MVIRFEETILSAGIRFNFGGSTPRARQRRPVYVPPPLAAARRAAAGRATRTSAAASRGRA